jgi:hypothetical protein
LRPFLDEKSPASATSKNLFSFIRFSFKPRGNEIMTLSDFYDRRDLEAETRGKAFWEWLFAGYNLNLHAGTKLWFTNGALPRSPYPSQHGQLFAALAPVLQPMPAGIGPIPDVTVNSSFQKSRLYRPTLQMAETSYISYYENAYLALEHLYAHKTPRPWTPEQEILVLQHKVGLIIPAQSDTGTYPRFFSITVNQVEHNPPGVFGTVGPFNVEYEGQFIPVTLSYTQIQAGVFGFAGRQYSRIFEPLLRRKERKFGRSKLPRWEKEHEVIVKGKKFTRNSEKMKDDPNAKGLGKAGTKVWRMRLLRSCKKAVGRAAFDAIGDGFDKWKAPRTKRLERLIKERQP